MFQLKFENGVLRIHHCSSGWRSSPYQKEYAKHWRSLMHHRAPFDTRQEKWKSRWDLGKLLIYNINLWKLCSFRCLCVHNFMQLLKYGLIPNIYSYTIYRIQVQGFNCSLRPMYFKTWKLFYVIQLPHRNVDLVERKQSNPRLLTLYCKDFQMINLLFPSADDCGQVAVSIENLSNIGSYKYKKAFSLFT